MTSRLTEVVVDCAEPRVLAEFWCAVLGYEVYEDEDGDFASIGAPGTGDDRRQKSHVSSPSERGTRTWDRPRTRPG